MKRRTLQVVVFLLLGAIVNVAVAWGLVLSRDADLSGAAILETGGRFWSPPQYRYTDWRVDRRFAIGSVVVISFWVGPIGGGIGGLDPPNAPEPLLPPWAPELSPEFHSPIDDSISLIVAREDGWPFLSMRGIDGYTEFEEFVKEEELVKEYPFVWRRVDRSSLALHVSCPPSPNADPSLLRFLPLGILFPGFAINTIFYAAVLGLLFFAPGSVRRAFRRRRGLCPACAYPIGTSPVCTECGKPVNKRSAISRTANMKRRRKYFTCGIAALVMLVSLSLVGVLLLQFRPAPLVRLRALGLCPIDDVYTSASGSNSIRVFITDGGATGYGGIFIYRKTFLGYELLWNDTRAIADPDRYSIEWMSEDEFKVRYANPDKGNMVERITID